MYLDLLNKEERESFLELARFSIGLNGESKEEEEEVLSGFKHECQMADYVAHRQESIDKIILSLKGSTKKIKKIILIELFGILLADGEVCENEAKFIDSLAESFDIM
jgi:hypothetical protein